MVPLVHPLCGVARVVGIPKACRALTTRATPGNGCNSRAERLASSFMTAGEPRAGMVGSSDPTTTPAQISAEIGEVVEAYEREGATAGDRTRPLLDYPPYRSSLLRHP